MRVEEAIYGKYKMRASKLGEKYVARAFVADSKARGHIAEAEGASSTEALAALRDQLEQRARDRVKSRRRIERIDFHVPTTEEYLEALQAIGPSPKESDMLGTHAKAGDKGLTPLQIARAGGYDSISNANALYGKLGRKLSVQLGVDPPPSTVRGGDVATGLLATYEHDPQGGDTMVWIMHDELRTAIVGYQSSRKA